MGNEMEIQPRQFTLKNIRGILEIFGLQGVIVIKGQGWSRCYVQHCAPATRLEPNPIPLQFGRVMFKDGKFSHFNFYLDPTGRIHDTMYYEVALLLFRATGIELDAPAWDDLVARAKLREDARCEQRARERGQLPAKAKGARRKLSAPNYAHAVMQTLESDIGELRQKDLLESLSCDDKPEQV
jgi:hypothetical protein